MQVPMIKKTHNQADVLPMFSHMNIDGLMPMRRKSSSLGMQSRLFWIKPTIYSLVCEQVADNFLRHALYFKTR